jgi:hypothetical protein
MDTLLLLIAVGLFVAFLVTKVLSKKKPGANPPSTGPGKGNFGGGSNFGDGKDQDRK